MEGQCQPHRYRSSLRGSDSPAIHGGIPLGAGGCSMNSTVKHWVDEESQKNCLMLYARGFSIASSGDRSCWKWVTEKDEPSDTVPVEVAELLKVRKLDARRKFDVSELSPETIYQVAFVIKLKQSGYGWEVPVNFGVTLPDGTKEEHPVKLEKKPKEKWIEIKAEEVRTSEDEEGEMEVFMYEHGEHPKSGLVFKGVRITPKKT